MLMQEYQQKAFKTAIYPEIGHGLVYPTLKLNGEAGEFAELVGKMFRDDGGMLTAERREKLILELGDVLWYITACAGELGVGLDEVGKRNLLKLQDRAQRGAITGKGSDR